MTNLVLEDGYREFTINNDPDRVIRFNPTDTAMVERFKKSQKALDALIGELGETKPDNMEEALERLDTAIKREVDAIFNQPVSEKVFGKQSPMTMIGGKPLFERFFEAVIPVITDEMKKQTKQRQKKVSSYVKAARGK